MTREAALLCQSQRFLQIIPQRLLRLGLIFGGEHIQILAPVFRRQQVNRTDDEIKRRGICQQLCCVFRRPLGRPQLYAQPQLDLIAHRRLRRAEILCQKLPVIGLPAESCCPTP